MESGYDFTPPPGKAPETQPAFAGGPPQPPPRPPKLTARDILEPGEPGKRIFVPDYIEIRELAELLGVKPFKVVAHLLTLRMFKDADDLIAFSTAAKIGRKHGYIVEKLL
jgi:translation initiation factor IF-2